jgi:single-stranded-DNA-specific exonuclease
LGAGEDAVDWLNPNINAALACADRSSFEPVLKRIEAAIDGLESIHIFGDYDCDGVTSTAILLEALQASTGGAGRITWELPARTDGYGLRPDVIERAAANNVKLLIAVDCGSNDIDLVALARAMGVDVVVIDHHQITAQIPDGALVLNPQLGADPDLRRVTAAGLAFLMVACLARDGYQVGSNGSNANASLELAAIGTVGDVGELLGLNRAIVHAGVKALRVTKRLGLKSLARQLKVDLATATAETVAFKFAPKLNAPGRIGSPDVALRLLTATDWDSSVELAAEICAVDAERKMLTEFVHSEVEAAIAQLETIPPVLVLANDSWAPGVLGPVAAKVSEKHLRPALILAGVGDFLAGSGRSFGDWDLAAALHEISDMLLRHGGHARAAGLSIAREQYPELGPALSRLYDEAALPPQVTPQFAIDADLGADEITLGMVEQLEALGPFGAGNPRPMLRWKGAQIAEWRPVGQTGSTAQVVLRGIPGQLRAVMFGGAQPMAGIFAGTRIDALIELSVDHWNGHKRVNARMLDFQVGR